MKVQIKHFKRQKRLQITIGSKMILYSYDTLIASFDTITGLYIETSTFHSETTSRHLNLWCAELKKDFQFKLLQRLPQEQLEKTVLDFDAVDLFA